MKEKVELISGYPGIQLLNPLDMHKELKRTGLVTATTKDATVIKSEDPDYSQDYRLDFSSWLPFASKSLNVSPKIEDYIIVPVMMFLTDLPNRNNIGFPLNQLVRWNIQHGRQAVKTWKGKSTFAEHANKDVWESKGVIFDTYLAKLNNYGMGQVWKVMALAGFDRTKDAALTQSILSGDRRGYSIGAYVNEGYTCSVCNLPLGHCTHISKPGDFAVTSDNQLAYAMGIGVEGFELSSVEEPAFSYVYTDPKEVRMGKDLK